MTKNSKLSFFGVSDACDNSELEKALVPETHAAWGKFSDNFLLIISANSLVTDFRIRYKPDPGVFESDVKC